MKKQIATLLALSTAAACILTYQPTAVGAEEFSVLDNTDKLVQEALEDNTDELGDALYDSVTEGDVPLYEADASSTQSELEKAAIEKGMYKDTFSFANHLCTLSREDFAERVSDPVSANMTDPELDLGYSTDISYIAYQSGLCFGMAAISVLVHNGELTPSDLQEGAETLYDVTLTDDVDALIAYYNSLQLYSEVELASIVEPAMLSKKSIPICFWIVQHAARKKALTLWQVFPPKKAAHTLWLAWMKYPAIGHSMASVMIPALSPTTATV